MMQPFKEETLSGGQVIPGERKKITSVALDAAQVAQLDGVVAARNAKLATSVWSRSAVIAEALDIFFRVTGNRSPVTFGDPTESPEAAGSGADRT
ncbi:MAG: hypothetical protein E6Q97_05720 [Desulfurellales bacterium]|nr:MAG: hypothetical protein E6Q97_05720 [Desulfurellales bacterium]